MCNCAYLNITMYTTLWIIVITVEDSITNTIRPQRICNGSNGSWLKLGTISTSANSTFKDTQSKLYHATSKVGADKLLICLIKHIRDGEPWSIFVLVMSWRYNRRITASQLQLYLVSFWFIVYKRQSVIYTYYTEAFKFNRA